MYKLIHASLAAGALMLAGLSAAHAAPAELSIMAPAGPGGGWDQTARSMQAVLQEAGIVSNVQVTNVPGAGGTIGLAQFVNTAKGDPTQLIVGGYVMVGAIIANSSPVSLADVTPIARLTGEYEAIVVPKASPIQTMADLVDALVDAAERQVVRRQDQDVGRQLPAQFGERGEVAGERVAARLVRLHADVRRDFRQDQRMLDQDISSHSVDFGSILLSAKIV